MHIEHINRTQKNVWTNGFDKTISPNDTMALIPGQADGLYFATGASGLHNVLCALAQSRIMRVDSLLDMGSGHGRVGRFLRAAFPDADLTFCEIYPDAVEFCAATFGGVGVHSKHELTEIEVGGPFDVIWCGSLFTHLDLDRTSRWMHYLCERLTPNGVFIGTFHGSTFSKMKRYFQPLISPETFDSIADQYRADGFGYGAYSIDNLAHQGSVGVSIWRPSRLLEMAWAMPGYRVLSYTERGWADAQDVLAIGRTDRSADWHSPVELFGSHLAAAGVGSL